MERLLESEADLAIAPLRDGQTTQLEAVPLMEVTLVPVAAPQFPAANTDHELSLEEINKYVHVLVQDSSRRTLSSKLKSLLEESNTWHVSDHYTKKEIILAGLGWGRLPEHMITEELRRSTLGFYQDKAMETGTVCHSSPSKNRQTGWSCGTANVELFFANSP